MRVLLANKFFYVKGGAERAFFDYEVALREGGHETVHFAMRGPDDEPSPWRHAFVSAVDFEHAGANMATLLAAGRLFYSREVRHHVARLIDEARPDVAILHNVYHQLGPALLLELAARSVPTWMVLHDYKTVCPSYLRWRDGSECSACSGGRFYHAALYGCGGSLARGALLAAESYWQRYVLRTYSSVDHYSAPSQYLASAVEEMGFPHRVEVVRNGLRIAESPVDPVAGRAVGFVGRLSPEKGVAVLLQAAARLPDVPFRIMGDGPLAASLQRRVQDADLDNVELLGHLAHGDVMAEMATWRAAVVPSLWAENSPYAALEPMSLGVPVVASRSGGLAELLEGSQLLVPARDAIALQDAIARVWGDDRLARDEGERGRAFVLRECDWRVFSEQIDARARELAAR